MSEKGFLPTAEMWEAMHRFNEELSVQCRHQACRGQPQEHLSHKASVYAFDGPRRTVIDGPFAETRELVAGFWIWEVKDMDEGGRWVKRCPNPMPGPSEIEIRGRFMRSADLQ